MLALLGNMNMHFALTPLFDCEITDTGFRFGTTANDLDDTGNGLGWAVNSRILADDGSFSFTSLHATATTTQLNYAIGFGLSIPTDATILGVQVQCEKNRTGTTGTINDRRVVLLDETLSPVGDNKATVTAWPTSPSLLIETYGGHSDLWGSAWTPAQINSANFGVAVAAEFTGTATAVQSARIDYVSLRVVAEVCGETAVFVAFSNPLLASTGRLMSR